MSACADNRKRLAKKADRQVVVAEAPEARQRDLVRPVSVHHRFAEFAFTIDHWRLRGGRRPRSTLPAANGGRTRVHGAAGGVGLCSRMRTKREHKCDTATLHLNFTIPTKGLLRMG